MTLWKNIVANDLQRVIHEHGSPITYYTRNISSAIISSAQITEVGYEVNSVSSINYSEVGTKVINPYDEQGQFVYQSTLLSSVDDYGQEITSYSGYSIIAWVKLGSDEVAKVIEPGIIPVQGIDVYISALDINFTPEVLDRILYDGATYEVRFVIPRLIEDTIVFWKIHARLVTPR